MHKLKRMVCCNCNIFIENEMAKTNKSKQKIKERKSVKWSCGICSFCRKYKEKFILFRLFCNGCCFLLQLATRRENCSTAEKYYNFVLYTQHNTTNVQHTRIILMNENMLSLCYCERNGEIEKFFSQFPLFLVNASQQFIISGLSVGFFEHSILFNLIF